MHLTFAQEGVDLFTHVKEQNLEALTKVSRDALHQQDQQGFTLLDYARIENDPAILALLHEAGVNSGVNQQMVLRTQMWLYLLRAPVSNLNGVYNARFANDILQFQKTRGLPFNRYITPDWYNALEMEAIYTLQSHLIDEGYNIALTGKLDEATSSALRALTNNPNAPLITLETIEQVRKKERDIDRPHLEHLIAGKEWREVEIKEEESLTQESAPSKEHSNKEKLQQQAKKEEQEERTHLFNYNREEIDKLLVEARSGTVLTLQVWLKLRGFFTDELDGSMGPATRNAIRAYQRHLGLKESGQLDAKWEAPLEVEVRKEVQQALKSLGLYDSSIDGIDGSGTRSAIEKFERELGIEETGGLSPQLILALFSREEVGNRPEIEIALADDQLTAAELDPTEKISQTEIEQITDAESLQESEVATLDEETPTIDEIKEEEEALAEAKESPKEERKVAISGYQSGGADNVTHQQLMLAYLGFYQGTIDGVQGESMKEAVKAFQKSEKLAADGVLGRQTLQQLERESINRFQRYLRSKEYMDDQPTGTLGPKTRRAVVELKKRLKLSNSEPTLDSELLLAIIDEIQGSQYHSQYLQYLAELEEEKEFLILLQKYLIGFGYLAGKADGIDGPATQKAISAFRKGYKIDEKQKLDRTFFEKFEKELVKKGQEYLKTLGHNISTDGIYGKRTEEAMNKFLTSIKHAKSDQFTADILMHLRTAADKQGANPPAGSAAHASNTAAKTPRPPKGTTVSINQISKKGQQQEGILSAAPKNRVTGRMQLVRNKQGAVTGCRVNNITMGMRWCANQKNGAQCSIYYKNGRVLSLRCR